jgi:hypothetical protein
MGVLSACSITAKSIGIRNLQGNDDSVVVAF